MGDRRRYRRLEELYQLGRELEFPDGTVMWIQVMNPLEADSAREESQTARARLVLALKEVGSDAQARALYEFGQLPRSTAVEAIVRSQQALWLAKADDKMRDDKDWKERLEIFDRRDVILAQEDASERELLNNITDAYLAEIYRRVGEEADYERDRLMRADDQEVCDRWLELYRERLGDQAAFNEHQATAAWYGARECDAKKVDDRWDHSACVEGRLHESRIYTDKADFRRQPEEIQNQILGTLLDLAMSERDAKNSASAENSSDSSALQSSPEESTASTSTEIPSPAPGTSSQLSTTP